MSWWIIAAICAGEILVQFLAARLKSFAVLFVFLLLQIGTLVSLYLLQASVPQFFIVAAVALASFLGFQLFGKRKE